MQSFLSTEWTKYNHCAKLVPQNFLTGSLVEGLNDPVHNKDFGMFISISLIAHVGLCGPYFRLLLKWRFTSVGV